METLVMLLVGAVIGAIIGAGLIMIRMKNLESRLKAEAAQLKQKALNAQRTVVKGQISEQLAPMHREFIAKYPDSKSARFMGNPIDYVIFDGLSDDKADISITFLEVKTGKTAQINPNEKRVRDAVKAGRVQWDTLHIKPSKEIPLPNVDIQ